MVAVCDGHGGDQIAIHCIQHIPGKVREALERTRNGQDIKSSLENGVLELDAEARNFYFNEEEYAAKQDRSRNTTNASESTTHSESKVTITSHSWTHGINACEHRTSFWRSWRRILAARHSPCALWSPHISSRAMLETLVLFERQLESNKVTAKFLFRLSHSKWLTRTCSLYTALTTDHKPTEAEEKSRIEKEGGWVINGRVYGTIHLHEAWLRASFHNEE